MTTTTKSRSPFSLPRMIVLLLSVAAAACGELTPDELAAQDTASTTAPSLAEQIPVIDDRQPARPDLADPEVAAEHTLGPASGDATAASVVGAPEINGLAIQPRKGEGAEPAPRTLIPGNQPATGASQLPPVSDPGDEPAACPNECPAGTTLNPATCVCECPKAEVSPECRQGAAPGDDTACGCTANER